MSVVVNNFIGFNPLEAKPDGCCGYEFDIATLGVRPSTPRPRPDEQPKTPPSLVLEEVDIPEDTDTHFVDFLYTFVKIPPSDTVYRIEKMVVRPRGESRPNTINITSELQDVASPEETKITISAEAMQLHEIKEFSLSTNGPVKGVKAFNALSEAERTITFTSPKVISEYEPDKPILTSQTVNYVIPLQPYPTINVTANGVEMPTSPLGRTVIHTVPVEDSHLATWESIDLKLRFERLVEGEGTVAEAFNLDTVAVYNGNDYTFAFEGSALPTMPSGLYRLHVTCAGVDKEEPNYHFVVPAFDLTSEPTMFTA
jgi:hypothetical protein